MSGETKGKNPAPNKTDAGNDSYGIDTSLLTVA